VQPERPLLEIQQLDAYYGYAHVLQGVSFAIGAEPTAIVGRNGMGKTTLCNAIMGIHPPRASGSIRFRARELVGKPPYRICAAGIGYVPQGRRLFPSLTTDEHLRMVRVRRGRPGGWTVGAVYELLPQLAARRGVGGGELSGGEQQMLAIARALLTNPELLVLDEPSEGLAPTIVETLIETIQRLVAEGVSILLVEQNLSVAAAVCDRLLVMVAGRIGHETTAAELLADEGAQQRFLGVASLAESSG
jgi:branched-chain amino acid transport system ATP-binding protein